MTAVLQTCRNELLRIFTLWPVFSVLVGGALLYSALYPQPYLNEALRDVPIAIVDQDGTPSSRDLARRIDATSDVAVAMVLPDVASAEREVFLRNIFGVLLIPEHFERDLLHGRASPVALYADASYFIMYQRIAGSVTTVARTFGAEVETARLIGAGVDPALAGAAVDPMPLTAEPLFNPQGGYATYVLPGALVLILQQILLMGVGLLATLPDAGAAASTRGPQRAGPLATVLGRLLAYLTLEALIVPFYLVVLPYLYGLPRLGGIGSILIFALPFVLAVSCLGLVLAAIFRTPIIVQLVSACIGLPFFFLAGFAWPAEAMPDTIRLLSHLLPSTAAIDGFVRLGPLGAPLSAVRDQFLTLWVLAIVYGGIAVALEAARRRRAGSSPGAADPEALVS